LAYLSSGVIALNTKGELRIFNEAAIEILDVDLEKYIGLKLGHVGLAQSQLTFFFNTIEKQANSSDHKKKDEQIQVELVGPRGKQIITLRGTPLPDGGYVAVFEDSTHMVQVQRDAAWGEVARRLAHEIKNPLTPIQLSAERLSFKLEDKLAATEAKVLNRSVETIVNQVAAMKKMVNEFSEYARSPAPKLKQLNLNSLISEVVSLYEGEGNAETSKFTLSLSTLPCIVMGDSTMLRQVVHNLLKNAQDASAQGNDAEVLVQTTVSASEIVFSVQDNGCGFPEDLLPHAFEPYMTTKPNGTGLGLAIVKKIIDEHEAKIKVENLSGENGIAGAIVTIFFPMSE